MKALACLALLVSTAQAATLEPYPISPFQAESAYSGGHCAIKGRDDKRRTPRPSPPLALSSRAMVLARLSCADTHGGGPGSSPSVPPEVPVPETALRLCRESHRRLTVELIRFRRGRNAGLSSARPPDCAPAWRAERHELT